MSELKYKVGDRVRIKSLDWYNENKDKDGEVICGEYDFVVPMTKFCGKVVTIQSCYTSDCYLIKEDNKCYAFTDEMIECKIEE